MGAAGVVFILVLGLLWFWCISVIVEEHQAMRETRHQQRLREEQERRRAERDRSIRAAQTYYERELARREAEARIEPERVFYEPRAVRTNQVQWTQGVYADEWRQVSVNEWNELVAGRSPQRRAPSLPGEKITARDARTLSTTFANEYEDLVERWKAATEGERSTLGPRADRRRRLFTMLYGYGQLGAGIACPYFSRLDNDAEHGVLYNVVGDGDPSQRLAFLYVRCPSTFDDHTLFVPLSMKTAKEARAWTFGMKGEEFCPEKET